MLLALIWACAVEPPAAPMRMGHFGTFDELVRATARGDGVGARRAARDLAVDPELANSDGAAAVGAAAGFIMVADADELDAAVQRVAAACLACHADQAPRPRPPGRDEAAWAMIWPIGTPESR